MVKFSASSTAVGPACHSSPNDSLRIENAAASAALIRHILDGKEGPPRDVVVLNAAAALWTAKFDPSPRICAARASAAIASDEARRLLDRWAIMSGGQTEETSS